MSSQSGADVYLIFSVNKSGEYFGYARMASSISEHAQTTPDAADLWDRPIYTYTPATESAPKGKITNDPPRGTIFWEAMVSNEEKSVDETSEDQKIDDASQIRERTFLVNWKSTSRVPFILTRGLRNPWNSNKDIKVARDGTELETSVGKRLVRLFHEAGYSPSSFSEIRSRPMSLLPQSSAQFYA
jgi:YT521-B-like domain